MTWARRIEMVSGYGDTACLGGRDEMALTGLALGTGRPGGPKYPKGGKQTCDEGLILRVLTKL